MSPSIWVDQEGPRISISGCNLAAPLAEAYLKSIGAEFRLFQNEGSHGSAMILILDKNLVRTIHDRIIQLLCDSGYEINTTFGQPSTYVH